MVRSQGTFRFRVAACFLLAATILLQGTDRATAEVPELFAEKGPEGTSISGRLPVGTTLEPAQGVTLLEGLEVPEDFDETALLALAALAALSEGTLEFQGRLITLEGRGTRVQIAAALDTLAALPDGFFALERLAPIDDGLPLGFTATKSGETVTLVGKMPFGTEPAALGLGAFEEAMIVAEVDARSPDFLTVSQAGLRALAAFPEGRLVVSDAPEEGLPAEIRLEGPVTRAGLEDVNDALGDLPSGVTPVIDVVFFDDGTPMRLRAAKSDAGLRLSGKLPFGMEAEDLGLDALPPELMVAEIAGQNDDFADRAAAGLAALALIESGVYTLRDGQDLSEALFGVARVPEIGREVASRFDGDARVSLTFLDDGTPPDVTLRFAAKGGVVLEGKLPDGLAVDSIQGELGVASFASTAEPGLTGSRDPYEGAFAALAAWFPEVERLTARFDETGLAAISIVPEPGIDGDLLVAGIRDDFGVSPELETAKLPVAGARRVGAATGRAEVFSGVAWLPVYDFLPSEARCAARSGEILADGDLTFVSGSTQLDARAARAINQLAGLIIHCRSAIPALSLEVAGHTDSAGGEDANLALSLERAEAVRDALILRGVSAAALTAQGYGEAEPIETNETEEGRALNRRTEVLWSNDATP